MAKAKRKTPTVKKSTNVKKKTAKKAATPKKSSPSGKEKKKPDNFRTSKFRQERIVPTGEKKIVSRPKGGPGARIPTKEVCAAIFAAKGNLSKAARNLGISRSALAIDYVKSEKHPEIKVALQEAREYRIDLMEDKLDQAVDNGEGWAICFGLKCLGKDRGYIEKLILGGHFGQDIEISIKGQGDGKKTSQTGIESKIN
jgi:hypothetical protein